MVVWVQPSWEQAEGLFLFVWGVSWGFHYTFTGSVLKTSQSDFSSQGYLFSFVVIALGNVLLIAGLLWIWLRIYGWGEGAGLWFGRVAAAYTTSAEVLAGTTVTRQPDCVRLRRMLRLRPQSMATTLQEAWPW